MSNIKIAILILCHKNPEQINMLLDSLNHQDVEVYVHIDKKSDINNFLIKRDNIFYLSPEKSFDVKWGGFSQIQATLNLLKIAYSKSRYDFFILISGQDFPIKKIDEIFSFLENNKNKNFINLYPNKNYKLYKSNSRDKRVELYYPEWILKTNLPCKIIRRLYVLLTGGYNYTFKIFKRELSDISFYTGSQWWCLNFDFVDYLFDYLSANPGFLKYFKNVNTPDEHFFQTIIMNSDFSNSRDDYLHYIDWTGCKNSPNVLTIKDLDNLLNSNKFFARKFDINTDAEILNILNY